MRVVIVGVGDIGLELAQNLSRRENNELVLVDVDEKRCDAIASQLDALVLNGDGTDPEILKKAQLSDADSLVATTGSDPINTVIAMLGRSFEVTNIVVKLNGVGLRSACHAIGVRNVVAPKISAAAEILSTLYGFDRVNFSMISRGGLRLVELETGDAKGLEIADLKLPEGSHLVAVEREDRVLIPNPGLKLGSEDELLVLVEDEEVLEKVREVFARKGTREDQS